MLRNEPLNFADAPVSTQGTAQCYIRTVHPETGLDVVYVPGEALPRWLVEKLAAEAEITRPSAAEPRKRGNKAVTADVTPGASTSAPTPGS